MDTYDSDDQVVAVLFQTDEEDKRESSGFWSINMHKNERNYSVSEKECLDIVWSFSILRPYRLLKNFIIHTDYARPR